MLQFFFNVFFLFQKVFFLSFLFFHFFWLIKYLMQTEIQFISRRIQRRKKSFRVSVITTFISITQWILNLPKKLRTFGCFFTQSKRTWDKNLKEKKRLRDFKKRSREIEKQENDKRQLLKFLTFYRKIIVPVLLAVCFASLKYTFTLHPHS